MEASIKYISKFRKRPAKKYANIAKFHFLQENIIPNMCICVCVQMQPVMDQAGLL